MRPRTIITLEHHRVVVNVRAQRGAEVHYLGRDVVQLVLESPAAPAILEA